jgi:hypothetical protein
MTTTARIAIAVGITCHSTNGPCPWLRTTHWSTRFYCHVFHEGREVRNEHGEVSGPGALQPWPECMAARIPTP